MARGGAARLRLYIACVATALVLAPLAWMWASSRVPSGYSVMDMGYADFGGGVGPATHAGHGTEQVSTRPVSSLRADPKRTPDVSVTLEVRAETVRLASGRRVAGYSVNGQSPGPTIRATVGDLVQVHLVNVSVKDGVSLHWHGVDVPNAEDGVAGVTQDAVLVGGEHTYRFVADQAGTFWYHSHQMSHEQVRGGLLGALVVDPVRVDKRTTDVVALVHSYSGARTVNGLAREARVDAPAGARVRVRVINTDDGPTPVWVGGGPYRLMAVDGTELNRPTPVQDKAVQVTAGGRADVEVTMPESGAPIRVHIGAVSVVLGSTSVAAPSVPRPRATLDLLSYGSPAPLTFDPAKADRTFRYLIGRRPGFLDGRPGMWWTVNGKMYPKVPMYTVTEGDVVRMRIANSSGEVHPMHLHGHHALVLSRNGKPSTGSPWWVDSLNVANGESYEIAFVADNPGIWMDHCHNLPHAAQGLAAHLMYQGVSTPHVLAGSTKNRPE